MKKIKLYSLLLCVFFVSTAHGKTYQCRNASGKILITDTACPKDSNTEKIRTFKLPTSVIIRQTEISNSEIAERNKPENLVVNPNQQQQGLVQSQQKEQLQAQSQAQQQAQLQSQSQAQQQAQLQSQSQAQQQAQLQAQLQAQQQAQLQAQLQAQQQAQLQAQLQAQQQAQLQAQLQAQQQAQLQAQLQAQQQEQLQVQQRAVQRQACVNQIANQSANARRSMESSGTSASSMQALLAQKFAIAAAQCNAIQ